MKKIKICVLGSGNFARSVHGPSYNLLRAQDPDLEYAAVADLDPAKAADFAAKFNIPRSYGDWREMAKAEKPDGICVLTGVAATSAFRKHRSAEAKSCTMTRYASVISSKAA